MSDIEHGTRNAYINHECRCVKCRAANAEYRRERYSSNKRSRDRDKAQRKAYQGAMIELRTNHPDEFRRIYERLRREAGLDAPTGHRGDIDDY